MTLFIKYCWLLPFSFSRIIKISPGTGTAAPGRPWAAVRPVPWRRQRHTAGTGSQSPHGLECALGAGSTTAATFGQRRLRFSSRYFRQNTTVVKTDIISTNYSSIFPPENRYNSRVRSPIWPYMEIKHKIAKECASPLPSLSFPLPWNWDDVQLQVRRTYRGKSDANFFHMKHTAEERED